MGKKETKMPRLAVWLLERFLPRRDIDFVHADFQDIYHRDCHTRGRFKAGMKLGSDVLKSLPGFMYAVFYWRIMMLKNYIYLTLRNLRNHTLHSVLNIAGLSLGMAVSLLIFLWIQNEIAYDRFHANKNEIAQVYSELQSSEGRNQVFMGSYYPLAKVLENECPEIIFAARYRSVTGLLIKQGDKRFINDTVGLVDPTFFKIFSFPFIKGDPETALGDNHSLVLTEKMAKKYFGNEDPIGKTLTIDNSLDMQVTGLIRNVPLQSSLQFDCVAPFVLSFAPNFEEPDHWGGNPLETYILHHEKVSHSELEQKITDVTEKYMKPESTKISFHLHNLSRKHLYAPQGGGQIQAILIFSAIAVFVLLIACINFMNLSTAKATVRAKEVGIRKVVGARKADLFRQFMGESLMISFVTLVIAVSLLVLVLPVFNQLVDKQLSFDLLYKPKVVIGFLSISLLTGLLSGIYPAVYLSAFQPGSILKGKTGIGLRSSLRKTLVVIQFSLSIFLMISTLVVSKQLRFMLNKDLGFDRENLVVLQMDQAMQNNYAAIRTNMLNHPRVLGVTKSLQGPWNIGSSVSAVDWDGKSSDTRVLLHWDYVDYDYFEVMKMKILAGRAFSKEFKTDEDEAYIVNQEAVRLMGMDSPVGQRLSVFRKQGKIIGVVKDFHFQPLKNEIKPFVFLLRPQLGSLTYVRIRPENISGTLGFLENTIHSFAPDFSTEPLFFNEVLSNYIYTQEEQTVKIAGYFTVLAVLISCFGLFGLAAFMAERRTKEIGIRKLLGASVKEVVIMLSRDFSIWVMLSNIIAWPAAYFMMQKFLDGYAHKASIGLELFILPSLAALGIALLTVSHQTIKAALANPADSLRYE